MMNEHRLEKPEEMKQIDKANMLKFCLNMSKYYQAAAKLAAGITTSYAKPQNVIIVGMGGSAIGGELLKDWARDKIHVPIEVNREYHLPAYANKETLVLITSCTGNTEEILSTFRDAIKNKCMIYCITGGGTLMTIAKSINIPYLQIPADIPPRAALPYMLMPLLTFLEKIGLTSGVSRELEEALPIIEKIEKQNAAKTTVKDSLTKTLAINIEGFIPVIYGFEIYSGVARRFKQQINENAKMMAKWDNLPELDHNEIVGYEKVDKQKERFAVIFIRDKDENIEMHRRIKITQNLMKTTGVNIYEVWSQGKSVLAKMLSLIAIADFLSTYLAILRGNDPTPVQTIDKLKDSLKKNSVKEHIVNEIEKITNITISQP
jgi:glucose/mannose-6-phosphate isomerase